MIRRNRQLARELKYLRSVARDVVNRYNLKIHSRLGAMARLLESSDKRKRGLRRPSDATMREMLSVIRRLKVKPKKGRSKDLRRIETIVEKLDDLMPSQP